MAAEVSFLTLPHPSPSTDAAFHRESHQGRDARAGGGSPPRPQLRRHRAGTRTRLPPLPSHRPVDGDERQSFSFLGQALWRSSPLSGARRFATRSDPSAAASTNRSCSASSAKAPASPPRCSSPWVRPLYPPPTPPSPNVSRRYHATSVPYPLCEACEPSKNGRLSRKKMFSSRRAGALNAAASAPFVAAIARPFSCARPVTHRARSKSRVSTSRRHLPQGGSHRG